MRKMKRLIAAAFSAVILTASFLPVFADSNETETTGGFVPIGIGAQTPSPEPEEEASVPPSPQSFGDENETELSTEATDTAVPEQGDISAQGDISTSEPEIAWTPQKPHEQFSDAGMLGSTYKPAVDAMTADGILNGFEDGSFRPTDTLTREQGAKIIAYLLLGTERAEALTCAESPYADVDADRWSAPVIVWCTEQRILHGMGDGTFRPAETLTGAQFAKMLLCAYGLGDPEQYVGDGWLDRVAEDGYVNGLFSGDESMKDNTPLERQQAALLAENARNVIR